MRISEQEMRQLIDKSIDDYVDIDLLTKHEEIPNYDPTEDEFQMYMNEGFFDNVNTLNLNQQPDLKQRGKIMTSITAQQKRKAIRRIIKEELLLVERNITLCEIIADEEQRMIKEGYTRQQINEGMFDFLKNIPSAFGQYLKQYFIEMALTALKIDTNTIFGYFLKNTLQNMEFMKISQYFGKGGCKPLTNVIILGIQEGLSEKGLDMVVEKFFGRRMQGVFSGTAREALMDGLENMTESMREPIEDFICNMSFSKLTGGLGGMFKRMMPGGSSSKAAAPASGTQAGSEFLSGLTQMMGGKPATAE